MGRAKLEIKYRENLRARRTTYTTRLKGLKKKAEELSVLCGVDIMVASFSPELNMIDFWPERDTPTFSRIKERYLGYIVGDYEGKGKIKQHSSFSLESFHEEKDAMKIKLQEVRERLEFLQRQRKEEEERLQAEYNASMVLQQFHQQVYPFPRSLSPHIATDFEIPSQQELSSHQQASPFAQILPPHEQTPSFFPEIFCHLADFNMPMEQDIHSHERPFQNFQCPPSHEQPLLVSLSLPSEQTSPFSQCLSPHLGSDSGTEDPLASWLPSDSNLWRHLDDFNCYDSLLLDYEASQLT
ncbi:hypothetical protein KFK09_000367 [Dendrobium nobile]|uniref:MADS-box domain-containing protein n=1 Tax=Dendrobium nobile TaxID=94219 RepID=A0A8T3CDT3_DENNO|nr:hypothetical protein KFK09_000367 [Dendrobium nobile]